LGGVNVDKVRAAAHGTFFRQIHGVSSGGVVHQDCAVAVGQAADQCAAGVFVDVGANAVDVFGKLQPVGVAFDVDRFAQDGASGGFN
jgi:hypothetical protein